MKRTTVFLEEQLLRQVKRAAEKEGVTFSTVVREALAQYIVEPRTVSHLPSFAGKFSSGSTDTSERVDELLWSDPHG